MSITIIIPVYKDWATLSKCLDSLISYASSDYSIIIINDNSNEADDLEKKILAKTSSHSNFKYYRNNTNLGFIKTCNKGVFELDKTNNDILLLNSDTEITAGALEEMKEVLYLSEKHGAVCPRSNNATLLSIPLYYHQDRQEITEESYEVYKKLKGLLPRYSVIPTAVGFCMLIKRNLISNFGLFDEVYGKGYNEENDFCMRISQIGYSILAANHAFVFHFESKSFGNEERVKRDTVNRKILDTRYPYYGSLVNSYFKYNIHPIDHFSATLLQQNSDKVLISLLHLHPVYNGTAIYGLKITDEIIRLYGSKYKIHIIIHKASDHFFGVSQKHPNVFYPDKKEPNVVFPICFTPSQIFNINILTYLNRVALKIVFTLQDIISIRCQYLLHTENKIAQTLFHLSYKYADGIITISDSVKKDAADFFHNKIEYANCEKKMTVIHHGAPQLTPTNETSTSNYVLVVGNKYHHKVLAETLNILTSDKSVKYVVLGIPKNKVESDNISYIKIGELQDHEIEAYYKNAQCIIFPSHYEGFGLPIFDALFFNKPVIIYKNELNIELKSTLFHNTPLINFYNLFKEIPSIVQEILQSENPKYEHSFRTWEQTAHETMTFITTILNQPIDPVLLQQRFTTLNMIKEFTSFYENNEINNDEPYLVPESKLKKALKTIAPPFFWNITKAIYKRVLL